MVAFTGGSMAKRVADEHMGDSNAAQWLAYLSPYLFWLLVGTISAGILLLA